MPALADDAICPTCGDELDWRWCWACGGDGGVDRSEDDPIQFGPGDWLRCDICDGAGRFASCRRCARGEGACC
jgi:hypothetical protein